MLLYSVMEAPSEVASPLPYAVACIFEVVAMIYSLWIDHWPAGVSAASRELQLTVLITDGSCGWRYRTASHHIDDIQIPRILVLCRVPVADPDP